jgi:hypothetical protein
MRERTRSNANRSVVNAPLASSVLAGSTDAVPPVSLPLTTYVLYRLGLRSKAAVARQALASARRDNALAGNAIGLETAVMDHTVIEPKAVAALQAYCGNLDAAANVAAAEDGAAEAAPTAMSGGEYLTFTLDPRAVQLGPRTRIVLSNAVVIVASAVALMLISLLLQRTFMQRRDVARCEGLRTAVANFGESFEAQFVAKALFELQDEATTIANWLDYSWATRLRESVRADRAAATVLARGLRMTVLDVHDANRNQDALAFLQFLMDFATGIDGRGMSPVSAAVVLTAAAELERFSALHAFVVQYGNATAGTAWNGVNLTVAEAEANATVLRSGLPLLAGQPYRDVLSELGEASAPLVAMTARHVSSVNVRTKAVPTLRAIALQRAVNASTLTASMWERAWWLHLPANNIGVAIFAPLVDNSAALDEALAVAANSTATALAADALNTTTAFDAQPDGTDDSAEAVVVRIDAPRQFSPNASLTILGGARPGLLMSGSSGALALTEWFLNTVLPESTRAAPSSPEFVNLTAWANFSAQLASIWQETLVDSPAVDIGPFLPQQTDPTRLPTDELVFGDGAGRFTATWAPIGGVLRRAWQTPSAVGETTVALYPCLYVVIFVRTVAAEADRYVAELSAVIEEVTNDARQRVSRDIALVSIDATLRGALGIQRTQGRPAMQCTPTSDADADAMLLDGTLKCPDNSAWLDLAARAIDAQVANEKFIAETRDGRPAVAAYAQIKSLNVALVFTEALSAVSQRARAALAAGIDRANANEPTAHAPDVALMALSDMPAARSFARDSPCDAPATCWRALERVWTGAGCHGGGVNVSHRWCAVGYGKRSDCAGCESVSGAQERQVERLTVPGRRALPLVDIVKDTLSSFLAPYRPLSRPADGPLSAKTAAAHAQPVASRATVETTAVVAPYAVLSAMGAAVVIGCGKDVVRGAVGDDAVTLVLVTLAGLLLSLFLIRLIAVRVVSQVEREWRRTREAQTREQHKLGHMVRHRIPVAYARRLPGSGVAVERITGAVATVDTFHFTEAVNDTKSPWSARDTVRYVTYFRHVAHAAARTFRVTILHTYGDVLQVVGGLPTDSHAMLAGTGGDGESGDEGHPRNESFGAAAAAGADAAFAGGPAAGVRTVLQFAAAMLQLATPKFVHQPWRIEAFGDLFRMTHQEKRAEQAEQALLQAKSRATMSSDLPSAGPGRASSLRRNVNKVATSVSRGSASGSSVPPDNEPRWLNNVYDSSGDDSATTVSGYSANEYLDSSVQGDARAGYRRRRLKSQKGGDVRVISAKDTRGVAMRNLALMPARAGVHVGQLTVCAARLSASTPQFDCFGDVFVVAHRLQATAAAGRLHVSTQVRDLVDSNAAAMAPTEFHFSAAMRTVMKGGTNVATYMVTHFLVHLPEELLNSLHVLHSDRTYVCPAAQKKQADSGSGGSSVSSASEVDSTPLAGASNKSGAIGPMTGASSTKSN